MLKEWAEYLKKCIGLGICRSFEWMGVKGIIVDILIGFLAGLIYGQNDNGKIALIWMVVTLALFGLCFSIFVLFIVPFQENKKQKDNILDLNKQIGGYKNRTPIVCLDRVKLEKWPWYTFIPENNAEEEIQAGTSAIPKITYSRIFWSGDGSFVAKEADFLIAEFRIKQVKGKVFEYAQGVWANLSFTKDGEPLIQMQNIKGRWANNPEPTSINFEPQIFSETIDIPSNGDVARLIIAAKRANSNKWYAFNQSTYDNRSGGIEKEEFFLGKKNIKASITINGINIDPIKRTIRVEKIEKND